jgi:hypothetical protein
MGYSARSTIMNAAQLIRLIASILGSTGTLALALLVWAGASDAATGVQNEWLSLTGHDARQAPLTLPTELEMALNGEYGRYQALLSPQQLLIQLQSQQIICVGEAHYEARDMQTAFELVRLLAQHRHVALAVERFSHAMQPQLDSLPMLADDSARLTLLKTLYQNDDYQKVWGTKPKDRSGYPTNTPSLPVFEGMMAWAAQQRVPLIGLDVTWAERGKGLGEDIAYRTALWFSELGAFLTAHHAQNYLVVLVAGISHCTNAPDTITYKLKSDARFGSVVSIGQRDAMYQYLSAANVSRLAQIYGFADLIVSGPQVAVVSSKGVAEFPAPPDYWLAVHTPDTWN